VTPRGINRRLLDGETGAKFHKGGRRSLFCEYVCVLGHSGNVKNTNFANLDLVMHEMYVNLDLFCSPMLHKVNKKIDSRNVMTIHNCRPIDKTIQFLQKITYLATLGNNMSNCTVLCFITGPGHC
jgi:hypothetical protein